MTSKRDFIVGGNVLMTPELRVPTWCPICQGLMKGRSTSTFYDFGACVNCFIFFIEGREERWKSGWRPSLQEIESMSGKM